VNRAFNQLFDLVVGLSLPARAPLSLDLFEETTRDLPFECSDRKFVDGLPSALAAFSIASRRSPGTLIFMSIVAIAAPA
jgi:hypothetical protein